MQKEEFEELEKIIKIIEPEDKKSSEELESDRKKAFLDEYYALVAKHGYDFTFEPKIIKANFPQKNDNN